MLEKFTTKFLKTITQEKEQIWLWIPIFLILGMVFSLSFFNQSAFQVFFASCILLASILLSYFNRFSYRSFIYIICGTILFGFLWAGFYQKIFILDKQITGNIYADLEGKVANIKKYKSPKKGLEGSILLISDLNIYKTDLSRFKKKSEKKPKSKKPKMPKTIKKFRKLLTKCGSDIFCVKKVNKASQKHEADKKLRRQKRIEERRNKPKKFTQKQIENTFLNLEGYQEIDREFFDSKSSYQKVDWQKSGERRIFPNPPSRISVSIRSNVSDLEVGDLISLRVLLQAPSQRQFVGGFDFSIYSASKKIGGYGRGIGDVKVLEKKKISSFNNFIGNLRKSVSEKIEAQINGDAATDEMAVATALMVGERGLISKETIEEIRRSGLAHLLAISGLHMAIAALIFFSLTRFVLSRSEYLALHFDIKKISAIAAIFSSYFYLQLAGSPVPATRSFIMVALVLVAVVIDRKTNLKRSIALAAFVLSLINPYNILSASFQFSFAAILSLACFHDFISRFKPDSVSNSFIKKFLWYFSEIAFASIVVQIATAPFLIYHFKNFSTYGLFANMLAIPLTTFITMPLGFLSISMMPLGLERIPLQAMAVSISWILDIARFISSLKFSYFLTPQMSKFAFALAVGSWLVICLAKSKRKWWLSVVFIASIASLFFVKQPNLLLDGQQKFFAIYDEKDGLIFSKKLRISRKRSLWMKEMREDEFKYLGQYSKDWLQRKGINCTEKICKIKTSNGNILIVQGRNKISEMCLNRNVKLIINLNSKYKLPSCFNANQKIDNSDFNKKSSHFIYFQKEKYQIKTAR